MKVRKFVIIPVLAMGLAACGAGNENTDSTVTDSENPRAELLAIADDYLSYMLHHNPINAYFWDMPVDDHVSWWDISPEAYVRHGAEYRDLLGRIDALTADFPVGSSEWALYGNMKEQFEISIGREVCRRELWPVNHMYSFYTVLDQVAARQPLDTPEAREDALTRWAGIADYVNQDIANIREGVRLGYTSPRGVVERVIAQMTALLEQGRETSPLYTFERRDNDPAFADALHQVVEDSVLPALTRYRDFLRDEYVDQAREDRSILAIPDGRACYMAYYRGYTSLKRTPEEVYAIGSAAVEANMESIRSLGLEHYGTEDILEAIRLNREDPANQLSSAGEYVRVATETVALGKAAMLEAFETMPSTDLVVEAYPEHIQGTGMSASYRRPVGDEPGKYMLDPMEWDQVTWGDTEITAVHEAYPGHHMEIALSLDRETIHPIQTILGNSAFSEGWARYSEALSEELGLCSSHHALIERRGWPARGMVMDTGLHILGWTDEQAAEFASQSGRFVGEEQLSALLDRISLIPAQLTAYDSGGLEIFALRRMAEERLGDDFDIRVFHNRFLQNGNVTMEMARASIEAWLDNKNSEE